ncbi:HIT family protein [Pseudalkalibacillus sp. JSM 102089]|uniref:HIT family protein n=1 Tax=Pseudalkalibacillus sp. JSM 102089 TaxID=3229856 RepID=UPI0035243BFB
MSNCVICEKHVSNSSLLIFQDNLVNVYHGPLDSGLLGYIHVEPRRHVENLYEFTEEETIHINKVIKHSTKLLNEYVDAVRVYVVTISEAVRHQHFHLIPRTADSDSKGLSLIEQATQQKASESLQSIVVEDLIKRLKPELMYLLS